MTPRQPTMAQAEARARIAGRLAAYAGTRATLHRDVVHASELGLSQAEIARMSGLSRQGVAKILAKSVSSGLSGS